MPHRKSAIGTIQRETSLSNADPLSFITVRQSSEGRSMHNGYPWDFIRG